jgi:hypothetical protein
MAALPCLGPKETLQGMSSAQTLFYGLFFGLGGGMLFLFVFLAVVYWQCVRSGRIRLGAGAPGELDDEQRILEEEQAGLSQLDFSQQNAYFRAKGIFFLDMETKDRIPRAVSS